MKFKKFRIGAVRHRQRNTAEKCSIDTGIFANIDEDESEPKTRSYPIAIIMFSYKSEYFAVSHKRSIIHMDYTVSLLNHVIPCNNILGIVIADVFLGVYSLFSVSILFSIVIAT